MRASKTIRRALEAGEQSPGLLEQAFIELWAAFPSARREMRRVIADVAEAMGLRVERERLRPGELLRALVEAALETVEETGGSEARKRSVARSLATRVLYLALDTLVMELGVSWGE